MNSRVCNSSPTTGSLESCSYPLDRLILYRNSRTERIRLPQSQRHPKERRDPLNRKNGEAHILAYYFASYGNHKIRAAIPTKTATKMLGIIATSIITSGVDGGFDYGCLCIG